MGTLTNSEYPDEMLRYVAFHQGLHLLLRQKQSSRKKYNFYLEFITCDPSIDTMDHPKFFGIISLSIKDEFNLYIGQHVSVCNLSTNSNAEQRRLIRAWAYVQSYQRLLFSHSQSMAVQEGQDLYHHCIRQLGRLKEAQIFIHIYHLMKC